MPFRVLGLDLIDLAGVCYLLAPSSPERPFQERGRDAQTHGSIYSHGSPLTAWWDRAPSASRARIARDDWPLRLLGGGHCYDLQGPGHGWIGGCPAGPQARPVWRSGLSHDRSVRLERKHRGIPARGSSRRSPPSSSRSLMRAGPARGRHFASWRARPHRYRNGMRNRLVDAGEPDEAKWFPPYEEGGRKWTNSSA
jgi:hypothetical protein